MKLLLMALQNISKRWTMPIRDWGSAINQFVILYSDHMTLLIEPFTQKYLQAHYIAMKSYKLWIFTRLF